LSHHKRAFHVTRERNAPGDALGLHGFELVTPRGVEHFPDDFVGGLSGRAAAGT